MGSIDEDILGGQGLRVGSTSGGNGDLIGDQGPKSGVPSWGHYWGPGSEMWGSSIGTLLGAKIRNVRSLHGALLGARV